MTITGHTTSAPIRLAAALGLAWALALSGCGGGDATDATQDAGATTGAERVGSGGYALVEPDAPATAADPTEPGTSPELGANSLAETEPSEAAAVVGRELPSPDLALSGDRTAAATTPYRYAGTGVARTSSGCTATEQTDFIDKTFWVFRRLMPRDCRVVMDNPVTFSWTQPKDRNTALPWTLRIYNSAGTLAAGQNLASPRMTLLAPLPLGKYTWTVSYVTNGGVTRTSVARRFEIDASAKTAVLPTATQLLSRLRARTSPRVLPAGATWAGVAAKAMSGEYAASYSMLTRTANASVLAPMTASPESRPRSTFPSEAAYAAWKLALMQQTNEEVRHLEVLGYAWRFTNNVAYAVAAKARLMNLVAWSPTGASSETSQPQANRNLYLSLAMGYDLVGSELSASQKSQLIGAFDARVSAAMQTLRKLDAEPYPSSDNTAIHFVTRSLLLVAGAPGFGNADLWLPNAWQLFQAQFQAMGEEDGGYAGSVAYSWYDLAVVSRGLATLVTTAGVDLSKWSYAHRMGDFMIAMTAPNTSLPNSVGDMAESRELYRQYTPDSFRLYAAVTRQPQHEWYWRQRATNINLLGYISPLHYMLLGRNVAPVAAAAPARDDFVFEDVGTVAFHDNADLADRSTLTFHASRFGSFSHGHADQNSFTFTARGVPLLINSGYYPYYGSPHHANVTRTTRYKNAVTFNGGIGQAEASYATTVPTAPFQSMEARGRLLNAASANGISLVTGDATLAYRGWDKVNDVWKPMLTGALRTAAYFKADGVVVVYDWLTSATPRKFEWNYHGASAFTTSGATLVANNGSSKACIQHYGVPGTVSTTTAFAVAPENGGANQGHARLSATTATTKAVMVSVIRADCKALAVAVSFSGDSARVTVGTRAVTMNREAVTIE